MGSDICPECGRKFAYFQVHCRCGHFLGFPNFRAAQAERDALQNRYLQAREDCKSRGLESLLDRLESLSDSARPVIGMSFEACDDILRSKKYRNYHERIDSGEREPASAPHHSDREKIGAQLFPTYQQHIHYAALSPDGRGLANYGPVAMRWEVEPSYLEKRATLLEENSFAFYERHGLGRIGAVTPQGYHGLWKDRPKLAVAKHGGELTPHTAAGSLPELLFRPGKTRDDDAFIEVAIYAEDGLDTLDVDMITLSRPPQSGEEAHRRAIIQEQCARAGLEFIE